MKKLKFILSYLIAVVIGSLMLTMCSRTEDVGNGAITNEVVSEKQWYLLELIPLNSPDLNQMAGGATNYTVIHRYTFWDAVITWVGFDIIHRETIEVKK